MPLVTATPRGQNNGQVITEFIDSVGTTSVTYTYPKTQEWLAVRNVGTKAITVTVGGTSQTLQPGQKWDNTSDFTSFSIVSSSGVQAFEATADEKGSVFGSPEGRYFASLPSGGGSTVPASKPAIQVVTKKNQGYFGGVYTYAGTKGGRTYRQRIVFACDCSDIQFLFTNPVENLGAGAANAITVKVSLETMSNPVNGTGNSTFYPLSREGVRSFTVNPDQRAFTDKIPKTFKKGDIAYLRIFVSSTSNKHPVGRILGVDDGSQEGIMDGDFTNFPSTTTERTNKTAYTTDGSNSITGTPNDANSWTAINPAPEINSGYTSNLCIGMPSPTAATYPVVAIIGDSIAHGLGAYNGTMWGFVNGFMQKAVQAADGAWIDLGLNGDTASGYLDPNFYGSRISNLGYCTHALVEYGVNDITSVAASDTRIAEITRDLQAIYNICKEYGINKVYACIPAVRTNSTDVWATVANQTAYNNGFVPRAGGGNNTWQDLVSWLKGNSVTPGSGGAVIPAPVSLDGYFDTQSAVTALNASNVPVWQVGMVNDDGSGVHPSDSGHTAMAALIPTSAFA